MDSVAWLCIKNNYWWLCDDLTARIFEVSAHGLVSNTHTGEITGREIVTGKMNTLVLFCMK